MKVDKGVIKDNVIIKDGTCWHRTPVPPFSMYGGKPARFISELPLWLSYLPAIEKRYSLR